MPSACERRWWLSVPGLLLAAGSVAAQTPVPVDPPRAWPMNVPNMPRTIRPGKVNHLGRTFVGIPDLFAEPPLGAPLNATFGVMRRNAAGHIFTLYRSDFLLDTATLTPVGAGRMSRICGDLRAWRGPVVVEATPDKPGLAESRREAILAHLQRYGYAGPEGLVVVGPPVAPGLLGHDAASNYQILMLRDQLAPGSFTVTPAMSTAPGGGGGSR